MLTEPEVHARYVANAEQYAKLLNIEAETMIYMSRQIYLPALIKYSASVAASVATKADIGIPARAEKELVRTLTQGIDDISARTDELEERNDAAHALGDPRAQDDAYVSDVVPAMEALRAAVDDMELLCSRDIWPVPSYNEMLFYV